MSPISSLPSMSAGEEWPDADFELNDDEPLHSLAIDSDKEDEDWDIEMDLGKTGGARAQTIVSSFSTRLQPTEVAHRNGIPLIRPPVTVTVEEEDEEDEEGFSTIKLATLKPPVVDAKLDPAPATNNAIDDDFESAFSLPTNLTRLSLRPLSHQSSKNSLEWGDKDQTTSSQSSDAYSTLGLDHASISSNSTQADTETEDEEDLDGLVLPSSIFDSGYGGKQLSSLLEKKKNAPAYADAVKAGSPNPEDDFEIGLVIGNDTDISPSRLLRAQQTHSSHRSPPTARSKSLPTRPVAGRPPSRLRSDRAKSPTAAPPPSSQRQLQKISRLSPSPPPRVASAASIRSQSSLLAPSAPSASAKPGSLRGQKSHATLSPSSSSSSSQLKLSRKASLPSLMDNNQASGSRTHNASSYNAPTAASRAKSQGTSGRIRSLDTQPVRPSTPSSESARLTMPANSSRLKSRPAITSIFPSNHRATSPQLFRPPSSLSLRSKTQLMHPTPGPSSAPAGPKVLRKPKRARTYGDGTELDAFDDLPTDRVKENQYRVLPRGHGHRATSVSSITTSPKKGSRDSSKATMKRKSKLDLSGSGVSGGEPASRTLKRAGRLETNKTLETTNKHKKSASAGQSRRKPTLIRNLGGQNAPKVVGDMKWNPQTLRWEGNDQALREFDAAMAPTRPALITQLTGSSIGSPVNSIASGARRVGNMIFDPTKMCWISTLAPEDDEPDVFAELADDEGDWEIRGGTIRASISGAPSEISGTSGEPPSPARSRVCSPSESGSDRGSRASMVCDVDDSFLDDCRSAEERHCVEMKGWRGRSKGSSSPSSADRAYLYEIRALATRSY